MNVNDFATEYSFNTESRLFPTLTPEQQRLWKEDIENAVRSGVVWGEGQLKSRSRTVKVVSKWSNEVEYAGEGTSFIRLDGILTYPGEYIKIITLSNDDE